MDKYKIDYWNNIKVGSIVQLDDEQTLEFLLTQKLPVSSNGADFEVVRIKELSLNEGSVKMKLVYLQLNDILWYLVISDICGEISLKIFYQPDDFNFGNREDVVKDGSLYVFAAPEDEQNYSVKDLLLTTHLEEGDIEYNSMNGVMYGTSNEDGIDEDFLTLVELHTETKCQDTDLLIIELCSIKNRLAKNIDIDNINSFIMYLKGNLVQINDVEVLN
jgi:hypothetical protein